MKEKTLLYGALSVTAATAIFGIVKTRGAKTSTSTTTDVPIVRVPTDDEPSNIVTRAEVPVRLTASDGTGLKLASMRAEAVVHDPLALTELHLVFENPEDRVLEGTFRMTLPEGASLSRFAMRVGNTWQEGEVVEKAAARRAYEDFLHRKQDPALMEQGAGNEFSARVFPIPARGKKEIIVTYASAIETGAPYVLPLRGLSQLGSLDVNVHAMGAKSAAPGGTTDATFGTHSSNVTPAEDFVVSGDKLPRSDGLRSEDLAIARVIPFTSSRPDPISSVVLLIDTSASRGLGLKSELSLVKALVAKLAPNTTLKVAAFDQEVFPVFEGKASEFGQKPIAELEARGALGASNFERAIDWANEQVQASKATRVVIVGDGVATAGETDAQKLRAHVEKLRDRGVQRMDAIAIGGIRDDSFLRTIVRGVLDHDGTVLDASLGPKALVRRLSEATTSGIPVKVDGAEWSWPETLDGVQAGDEVLVYAKLPADKAVKVTVGTQQVSPDLRRAPRPLVERAWAQAKIQSLLDAPVDGPEATKRRIVELSTTHRVLSPFTSMLVLESDADYRRFGIDRTAKVDILAIEDGRVAVTEAPRSWADKTSGPVRRREHAEAARPRPSAAAAAQESTVSDEGATGDGERELARSAPAEAVQPGATAAREDSLAEAPVAQAAPSAPAPAPPPASEPTPMADLAGAAAAPQMKAATSGARGSGAAPTLGAQGFGSGGGGSAAPTAEGRASHSAPRRVSPSQGLTRAPTGHTSGAVTEVYRSPADRPAPNTTLQVRTGALVVQGQGLDREGIQRALRAATPRLRTCYASALQGDREAHGRLQVQIDIDARGTVTSVMPTDILPSRELEACAIRTLRSVTFPANGGGGRFTTSFDFVNLTPAPTGVVATRPRPQGVPDAVPYEGRFRIVMTKLSSGDKDDALAEAKTWQSEQPGDVLALVALGEAYEGRGDLKMAARAYGSILELFSFRADSRRFAGERLERLADKAALELAVDTYEKAAEQRPDHPASHRLLGYARLKAGKPEAAFEAIEKGAQRTYPAGRFAGVQRILKEDLGLVAAAWLKAEPNRREEITQRLTAAGATLATTPSLRFVLNWETDANDVDFHIYDGRGGHAFYQQRTLPSGGSLYADVTTGYGPECFTIEGARDKRAYPYTLQAHYYSRGPMGYGMGKLEVVEHDGHGGLSFEERPFVVMTDRAYVDLGVVDKGSSPIARQ